MVKYHEIMWYCYTPAPPTLRTYLVAFCGPLTPVYSLHRINTHSRWHGVKLWLVASKRVAENNGPRTWRFLPPAICLQLFISSACVLQRRAPARRPICACRSGGGEEVTALPSARLSPCTEGEKKKNRREHLKYDSPATQPHLEHNSPPRNGPTKTQ